jgi:hypothetical protein
MKREKSAALFATLDKKREAIDFMKFVFKIGLLPLSDASGTTALLLTPISKCNVANIKSNVLETREE